MAFRKLEHFDPNSVGVDPRVDSRWIVTSVYTVLAVTPFTTFKELNNYGGLSSLKLLGLIDSYNVNESVNISQTFEIGNKKAIIIPGKMRGQINISSNIVESINLLGSIYETVLPKLLQNNSFKNTDTDLVEKLLYTPLLDKTYYSDPNKQPDDLNSESLTPTPDKTDDFYKLLNETPQGAESASGLDEITSKGALLFSLDDLRLRIKFGLCFLLFQSSERVRDNAIHNQEISTMDYRNVNSEEYEGTVFSNTGSKVNYKLIGGQFYENCIISDYQRSSNSSPVPPNMTEGLNIIYNGTSKLNVDPQKQPVSASRLSLTPSAPPV